MYVTRGDILKSKNTVLRNDFFVVIFTRFCLDAGSSTALYKKQIKKWKQIAEEQ